MSAYDPDDDGPSAYWMEVTETALSKAEIDASQDQIKVAAIIIELCHESIKTRKGWNKK
jgi:hypothetical protein